MPSSPATTGNRMAKKKESGSREDDPKVIFHVEIPRSLKERFRAIAEAHGRKLNAEAERMFEAYCARFEGAAEADENQ